MLTWWREGNRNGSQLYRELTSRGYKGSAKAMYNYLATLRTPQARSSKSSSARQQKHKGISSSPPLLENFSTQRATWLFVRKLDDLDETEQEELALIRQASPSSEAAYRLTQAFLRLIREHTGEGLDGWLNEVEVSQLPEFKSFAVGVRKDKAAVLAGLTLTRE